MILKLIKLLKDWSDKSCRTVEEKEEKKTSIEYTKKIKVNQPPFTLSNMFESAFLFKLHLGPRWRDENIFSSPDVSTVFQGCEASICTGSQKGLKHENELKYGTVTGDFRTLTLDGALRCLSLQ